MVTQFNQSVLHLVCEGEMMSEPDKLVEEIARVIFDFNIAEAGRTIGWTPADEPDPFPAIQDREKWLRLASAVLASEPIRELVGAVRAAREYVETERWDLLCSCCPGGATGEPIIEEIDQDNKLGLERDDQMLAKIDTALARFQHAEPKQ